VYHIYSSIATRISVINHVVIITQLTLYYGRAEVLLLIFPAEYEAMAESSCSFQPLPVKLIVY